MRAGLLPTILSRRSHAKCPAGKLRFWISNIRFLQVNGTGGGVERNAITLLLIKLREFTHEHSSKTTVLFASVAGVSHQHVRSKPEHVRADCCEGSRGHDVRARRGYRGRAR